MYNSGKFMNIPKKFLHNRLILAMLTIIALLLVVGVASVLLRFDAAKNPTTITAYRPNISGSGVISGKAIDIYEFAIFMLVITGMNILISIRAFHVRHFVSIFILGATIFLLILSIVVSNALISLQ
jgi:hypothetical protein